MISMLCWCFDYCNHVSDKFDRVTTDMQCDHLVPQVKKDVRSAVNSHGPASPLGRNSGGEGGLKTDSKPSVAIDWASIKVSFSLRYLWLLAFCQRFTEIPPAMPQDPSVLAPQSTCVLPLLQAQAATAQAPPASAAALPKVEAFDFSEPATKHDDAAGIDPWCVRSQLSALDSE